MADRLFKPGEDNRPAGKYVEVGTRGGTVPRGHKATIENGERLPPTSEKGHKWKKVH
jgi:hypothetical protein